MTKYIPYTKEQKEYARQVDLCEFLHSKGENLKRIGQEWIWNNGNGKVCIKGNKWYHHYEQKGGLAIDFVQEFYNVDFCGAMEMLLNQCKINLPIKIDEKQKEFILPNSNNDMRRVYAYLLQTRLIDREILSYFVHEKMIKVALFLFTFKR